MNRRERCERSWRKMRGVTVSFIRHPDQSRGIPRRICRCLPWEALVSAWPREGRLCAVDVSAALCRAKRLKGVCRLFAPQRHRNFGTLISEDDLAILNRPERHVINIFAELQAKLLALPHDHAIQDRIVRSCAHRDRSQGERAGRQVRAGSRVEIFGPGLFQPIGQKGSRPSVASKVDLFFNSIAGAGSTARTAGSRKVVRQKTSRRFFIS